MSFVMMNPGRHYVTESRARKPNDVLHGLCGTATFATNGRALALIFKLYMQGFLQVATLVFISWSKFFRQEEKPIGKTTLTKPHRSFTHD